MRWRVRLAVLPCLIIAGCGGQTGSPEGTGGGEHTSAVGIATISYGGKIVPAASFSQSGVTATSMAGALFSKVTLNPAQKPENSAIVFSMNGQIWTLQNGIQKQITNTNQNFNTPAVSKNGLVVFSGIDFASLNWQLYTCNLDGSNLHRITSSAISHSSPAFSPSGAKIVCSNGGDSLYVLNSDGSNEQKLTITGASAGKSPYPTWTADGTQILFSNYDSVSTRRLLYSVPSGGGAATQFPDQGINCTQPSCSPNGFTVAFHTNFSSTDYIYSLDLRAPQFSAGYATAPSGTTFGRPSFAPDGNSIYFAATSSATSAIENQIISSPSSLHAVASYPAASESIYDVSCSPYFAAKTFIGAGGLMSSAAGFLWTQRGDGFGSFASFSATTPSKLTITQQNSGGSGGALVYLAKADVITKIVYTNDYFGAYSGIASTGSQALISVSATTGQIDTVAPLTEPGLQRLSRGGTSYEGRFTAVYDAHGKNLARSGASHIELDPKTGAVTSWR